MELDDVGVNMVLLTSRGISQVSPAHLLGYLLTALPVSIKVAWKVDIGGTLVARVKK